MTEVGDLRDEFVVCRTIGHSWDDHPSPEVPHTLQWHSAKAALFLRCTRCHTERFDYLDGDMTVGYRYYRYPDRYRGLAKGAGSRPLLRGEMFRRSLLLRKRRQRAAA
jgi:hypothetical protein